MGIRQQREKNADNAIAHIFTTLAAP